MVTPVKTSAVFFSFFVVSQLCSAAEPFGEFVELHSCDLYTGGCTASAESTLLGRQVFRVWSIERGDVERPGFDTSKGRSSGDRARRISRKKARSLTQAEIFVPKGLPQAKREALLSWAAAQHPLPRATPSDRSRDHLSTVRAGGSQLLLATQSL